MKTKGAITILLLCAAFTPHAFAQKMKPELFGVRLGMTEAEARARLSRIGRWVEGQEQRRDSIWELKSDKRFSHVIVGFEKQTRRVRYVTGRVRAGGEQVHPADAFDLGRAERYTDAAGNYHYKERVRARRNGPAYVIMADGKSPESLTRLSIKLDEQDGSDEEEDKKKSQP